MAVLVEQIERIREWQRFAPAWYVYTVPECFASDGLIAKGGDFCTLIRIKNSFYAYNNRQYLPVSPYVWTFAREWGILIVVHRKKRDTYESFK